MIIHPETGKLDVLVDGYEEDQDASSRPPPQ
jgi:hypothetical protein